MEWAELVLEYVKVLAWPIVVGSVTLGFRGQIAAKIADLKDANTPVGGASFFDREAKSVEERADRAADLQEAAQEAQAATKADDGDAAELPTASPPAASTDDDTVAGRGDKAVQPAESREDAEPVDAPVAAPETDDISKESRLEKFLMGAARFSVLWTAYAQLNSEPDFDTAREIAATSPNAAVMLAYSQVEKMARAAWTLERQEPAPPRSASLLMRDLAKGGGLAGEFAAIGRNLSDLRNRVAHGAGDASPDGALDFVTACERLSQALCGSALSRFRHPSNADTWRSLAEWSESQAAD